MPAVARVGAGRGAGDRVGASHCDGGSLPRRNLEMLPSEAGRLAEVFGDEAESEGNEEGRDKV